MRNVDASAEAPIWWLCAVCPSDIFRLVGRLLAVSCAVVACFPIGAQPADPPTLVDLMTAMSATVAGDPVVAIPASSLPNASGDADFPFAESLSATASFRLSVKISVAHPAPGSIVADLTELKEKMKVACAGGRLLVRSLARWTGDPQMSKAYRTLDTSALIGDITCLQANDSKLFAAQVLPAEAFEPTFPFGRQWNVYVHVLAGDALARSEKRLVDYKAKTTELRAKLSPGAKVQVNEAELPVAGERDDRMRKISVCGLVIDVKGPLAHVQVQRDTLWVPTDKLFPQGEPVASSQLRVNSSQAALPQAYCGK